MVRASRVSPEHGHFDGDRNALYAEAVVHAGTGVFGKAHGFVNDLRHTVQVDSLTAEKKEEKQEAGLVHKRKEKTGQRKLSMKTVYFKAFLSVG